MRSTPASWISFKASSASAVNTFWSSRLMFMLLASSLKPSACLIKKKQRMQELFVHMKCRKNVSLRKKAYDGESFYGLWMFYLLCKNLRHSLGSCKESLVGFWTTTSLSINVEELHLMSQRESKRILFNPSRPDLGQREVSRKVKAPQRSVKIKT